MKLPRMKGRVPAIKHLEQKILRVQKHLELVQNTEETLYEGVIEDRVWVGHKIGYQDARCKVLLKAIGFNKESVKVCILSIQYLTEYKPYKLKGMEGRGKGNYTSLTFDDFGCMSKVDIKMEQVPLYLGNDFVSQEFKEMFLK